MCNFFRGGDTGGTGNWRYDDDNEGETGGTLRLRRLLTLNCTSCIDGVKTQRRTLNIQSNVSKTN